jgi:hypothetical protein
MKYWIMDSGQTLFILCQLVFGAVATFLAIMLWSRTRDAAWMLIVIGTIIAYVEIVHHILGFFGMGGGESVLIGTVPLVAFILPLLRLSFFIAAFLIMIIRQFKQK